MDRTTRKEEPVATRVSMAEAARRQRVPLLVGSALAVAFALGGIAFGNWSAGVLLAVGVALAMLNTVLTELSMMRMTAGGDDLSRKRFAMSALMRLSAVSLVAFVLVVAFWPVGGLVLVGLALFQLLTVVLTGFPLLKELRGQ